MTYADDAKAILADGGKIGFDLAVNLTTEVAMVEGLDFVYRTENGILAGPANTYGCTNVHYEIGDNGLYVFDPETGWPKMKPGCLVGRVFCVLFPIEDVPRVGASGSVNHKMGEPFDNAAEFFLGSVQSFQDNGQPWGEAIDRAIEDTKTWPGLLPKGDE